MSSGSLGMLLLQAAKRFGAQTTRGSPAQKALFSPVVGSRSSGCVSVSHQQVHMMQLAHMRRCLSSSSCSASSSSQQQHIPSLLRGVGQGSSQDSSKAVVLPCAFGASLSSSSSSSSFSSPVGQRRSFSKKRRPMSRPNAGLMAQNRRINVVFISPGILVDPWREPEKLSWSSLFTAQGWRDRWQRYVINTGKSIFTLSKCMTGIPNFSLRSLKEELGVLYEKVNEASAKGNKRVMESNVTDKTYTLMKKEMIDRQKSGWKQIDWALQGPIQKIELVQGRVIQVAEEVLFAQLTCKISSKQSLAAYDSKGKIVAGDPKEVLDVTEHWVFERGLGKKLPTNGQGIKWRVAARLGADV